MIYALTILICDLQLGGMTGHDVICHFRAQYPWVSVIVLTAQADMGIAYRLIHRGICRYLLKPVTITTLLEATQQALTEREAGERRQMMQDPLRRQTVAIQKCHCY